MTCGKWKLEQEIGRGAYGVVYRAEGPDFGARPPKKIGENRGESWFYAAITVFDHESIGIDAEEGLSSMRTQFAFN